MSNSDSPPNEKPDLSIHGTLLSPVCVPHSLDSQENIAENELDEEISKYQERRYGWEEFDELVKGINSDEQLKRYYGTIGIHTLLIQGKRDEEEADIQKVIDAGLIPKLIEFLKKDDEPSLQKEAIQALVCVATGSIDQVTEIFDQGVIPILLGFFKSDDSILKERALKIIGGLSTHLEYRDLLVDCEVVRFLLPLLEAALVEKEDWFLEQGTWVLSNICGLNPRPTYEKIAESIPILCTIIKEVAEIEVCSYALEALGGILEGERGVAKILESHTFPHLLKFLSYPDDTVKYLALRALQRIILTGSADQLGAVLDASLLKKLFKLLKIQNLNEHVEFEVYAVLEFISMVNKKFFLLVLDNPEYVQQCISGVLNVCWGAITLFHNVAANQNKDSMIRMARTEVLDSMCRLIQKDIQKYFTQHEELIDRGLETIERFLEFGALISRKEATNSKSLIKVKQKDVLKRIEKLKKSQGSELSKRAFGILNKYFKEPILRKNLRLKRAIICFRNERHALFGLSKNEKKRLCI